MRYLTIPVLLAAVFITGCITVDRRPQPQAIQTNQITPAVVVATEPVVQQTPQAPAAPEAQAAVQPAVVEPPKTEAKPEAETAVQPPSIAGGEAEEPEPVRMHKVWINESLWSLAKKYYGDGRLWTLIYDANKDQIVNPKKIFPKQMLIIPENGN